MMSFPKFSRYLLTPLLCGCLFTGCAWFGASKKSQNTPAGPNKKKTVNAAGEVTNAEGYPYYIVKADFTPLYRSGPQQPNGPDQSLPKDTLISILKKGFGYSRVQLESGMNGYVATDDLEPATADRVGPAPSLANTENNSAIVEHYSAEKAAQSSGVSMGNAEALPELPEPRLEPEPTPVDKPDFRY